MSFASQYFSDNRQDNRPGILRPTTYYSTRPTTYRSTRTSGARVRFKTPSPERNTRRRSKTPRSPRAKFIKRLKKGFKHIARKKYDNKYARNISEFANASWPLILAFLTAALYSSEIFKKD